MSTPILESVRWYDHHECVEIMSELFNELGAKGIDMYSMPPGISETIRDLTDRVDDWEERLVHLLDFRLWDIERLQQRDKRVAKPRIDVYAELTSKDNLSVKWRPRGDLVFIPAPENDFAAWRRSDLNDEQEIAQRPNNELLYIRGVKGLVRWSKNDPWRLNIERRALYASRALMNRIIQFLRHFCDVRVITDFFFVMDDARQVTSWSVDDVADRWIAGFEGKHGLTAYKFCQRLLEHRGADGKVHTDKLSRALRKDGFEQMTPRPVQEIVTQFEGYTQWPDFRWDHRELFEMWQSGNGKGADVIPLRP